MKKASDLIIPCTFEQRRVVLLEKFLYVPSFYEGYEQFDVQWDDPAIFEKKQPLVVEYCSGNGQWIAMMAEKMPQLNWIAVEKDFERARKIWLKIFRLQLKNLFVVYGEGFTFSRYYLANQSIHQIYVNFPDPWPKRRHAKHRVIQGDFVAELKRILIPDGVATIVTDDAPYSEWIIQHFGAWKSNFESPCYRTEWPEYGDSYFHSLWLSKNRTIRFHQFINRQI